MVYTDFRPTPLQHYVFPARGQGLYLVVDEKGAFREEGFSKAVAALADNGAQRAKKGDKRGAATNGDAEQSDIFKIVRLIMERGYDPVSHFSSYFLESLLFPMGCKRPNAAKVKWIVGDAWNGYMKLKFGRQM